MVGAPLLLVFAHAELPGAFGWIAVMVAVAGQVAGRRGRGVPRAIWSATVGVATGSVITLGALPALGVISIESGFVVPVGGMIVSGAMQAAGIALRRLCEDAEQARPAIEARLCLGLSAREAFLASPTLCPAHRLVARHRLPQGGRAEQPARRDDRA